MKDHDSIEHLASAVFDNGRRGKPRAGCDCLQCFGYCMIDPDAYTRDMSQTREPLPELMFTGDSQ